MSEPGDSAPELVLGPMLRYAGTESATFWLETSASCEIEILGRFSRISATSSGRPMLAERLQSRDRPDPRGRPAADG